MVGPPPPAPGALPAGRGPQEMLAAVAAAARPLGTGEVVVVAVSGGGDSAALARLLARARPDLRLVLAHVRHGLRDDTADVAAVEDLAAAVPAELHVVEVEVVPGGEGLEAAAREARYAALRGVAGGVGARWIAVGHTADDQAETVVMRIARGTGVDGLAAMAVVAGDVVRPLLRLRRADVRRFTRHEGLPAVGDPMNDDPAFRRVRARTEVLPTLARLGPDPVGALTRLADLARADAAHLDAATAGLAGRLVRAYGPARAVATDDLAGLDEALARRLVRALIAAARGEVQPVAAAHVEAALRLAPGGAADLPGVTVSCGGGWLAAAPRPAPDAGEAPLAVPGVTPWPPAGIALVAAEPGPQAVGGRGSVPPEVVPPGGSGDLARAGLQGPVGALSVRRRRPGDRITTAAGTRKLSDVLVDAGIPRVVRDLVPVVVAAGRAVWVPGVAVAHGSDGGAVAVRVTATTLPRTPPW